MVQLGAGQSDAIHLYRVRRPLWLRLLYRSRHLYQHRLTGQLMLLTAAEERDIKRVRTESTALFLSLIHI